MLAVAGVEPEGWAARVLPPVVAMTVYVAYFAVLESRGTLERPTRGTLGKAAFKLAVEDLDGGPMRPAQSALRQIAKLLLCPFALITLQGRAPHDWAAGTRVAGKTATKK